jgi:hypothetical protein
MEIFFKNKSSDLTVTLFYFGPHFAPRIPPVLVQVSNQDALCPVTRSQCVTRQQEAQIGYGRLLVHDPKIVYAWLPWWWDLWRTDNVLVRLLTEQELVVDYSFASSSKLRMQSKCFTSKISEWTCSEHWRNESCMRHYFLIYIVWWAALNLAVDLVLPFFSVLCYSSK